MKKITLPVVISILSVMIGCATKAPAPDLIGEKYAQREIIALGNTSQSTMETEGERADTIKDNPKITVTARQWSFTPNKILVKQGDTVRIKLTSENDEFTLAIPALGLATYNNELTFIAKEKGEIEFICGDDCALTHPEMKGVITIE